MEYLHLLGITDIYACPIFQARPGSMHGYDIVDPQALNPELGTARDFDCLCASLKQRQMGWLQDVVPNHMAYDGKNRMLVDVFENKERSRFYGFFDIDWVHHYENFKGRVLAPFLGRFYSECLESGEIRLVYDRDGFGVQYYELRFPLLLSTYPEILETNLAGLQQQRGGGDPGVLGLLELLDRFRQMALGPVGSDLSERVARAKAKMWALYNDEPSVREYIHSVLQSINGVPDQPESFSALDSLLSRQAYRLSYWKVASEELNYRRFFTINDIISLRVEKKDVFLKTHELIFRMIQSGNFTGLRIDHIDGLYDPKTYLLNLRKQVGDTYVVVEKILAPEESLPERWPVQGTTGYDFLNKLNRLFCQGKNQKEMTRIYYRATDFRRSFPELVTQKKRMILGKHMAGDVDNLAYLMKKVASRDRYGRDISLYGLRRAIVEVMAFFPVYRSYLGRESFSPEDQQALHTAIEASRKSFPRLGYELNFIEKFLQWEFIENLNKEEEELFWHFFMRFQQLTSPLMAKGFEDTALYVYNGLVCLNEVGGDPLLFGCSVPEFFDFVSRRSLKHPHALNATATHDTKRGEDVRARIQVLSERPGEWKAHLSRWFKWNRSKKVRRANVLIPDRNDEVLLYQTVLGSLPFSGTPDQEYVKRIQDYLVKAVREAKEHSSWFTPDAEYELGCQQFIERVLDPHPKNLFWQDFVLFQRKLAAYGIWNSLSQQIIKMTVGGVPDFYQGGELWDLNLVDPDNRRPVDFAARRAALQDIVSGAADPAALLEELLASRCDGRIKLYLIRQVLTARQQHPGLFQSGDCLPLRAEGPYRDSVIAYLRHQSGQWALVCVPRFLTEVVDESTIPLGEVWQDTRIVLPPGMPEEWQEAISGQTWRLNLPAVDVRDLFLRFPGVVFVS